MKINCAYKKLVKVEELVKHPRNPNTHTPKQIELLAKILKSTGFRSPIVVSERSGFIVKGHGRLESAIKAGFDSVPVDVQSYESEAEEYADMIADNRIAELSEMDSATLKDLLQELDSGAVDMDLTGFDQEALEDLMSQFFQGDEKQGAMEDQTNKDAQQETKELIFELEKKDFTRVSEKLAEINQDKCKALIKILFGE